MTELGILTTSRLSQCLKADAPMVATEPEMLICASDSHPLKVSLLVDLTLTPIYTSWRAGQKEKAEEPMSAILQSLYRAR